MPTATIPAPVDLTSQELATVHATLARRLRELQATAHGLRADIGRLRGVDPADNLHREFQRSADKRAAKLAHIEAEAARLVALLPLFAPAS